MTLAGVLLSLDIDGTLAIGSPPGPIGRDAVAAVVEAGAVVGSASDRTVAEQTRLWVPWRLAPAFTLGKHRLATLRDRHACTTHVHVGDRFTDELHARQADFTFVSALGVAPGPAGLLDLLLTLRTTSEEC